MFKLYPEFARAITMLPEFAGANKETRKKLAETLPNSQQAPLFPAPVVTGADILATYGRHDPKTILSNELLQKNLSTDLPSYQKALTAMLGGPHYRITKQTVNDQTLAGHGHMMVTKPDRETPAAFIHFPKNGSHIAIVFQEGHNAPQTPADIAAQLSNKSDAEKYLLGKRLVKLFKAASESEQAAPSVQQQATRFLQQIEMTATKKRANKGPTNG